MMNEHGSCLYLFSRTNAMIKRLTHSRIYEIYMRIGSYPKLEIAAGYGKPSLKRE